MGNQQDKHAPRVAFLGFCERSEKITAGHPALWHTNIIGLSNIKVSFVFPLNLRRQKLAVAIYEPKAGEYIKIDFRGTENQKHFELLINVGVFEAKLSAPESIEEKEVVNGMAVTGWHFTSTELSTDVLVYEPGTYELYLVEESGESRLGAVEFIAASAPSFSDEEIAAIRSNPLAVKFIRMQLKCTKCGDVFRVYAGIERSQKSEEEGWLWSQEIHKDRFKCQCGEQDFILAPIKSGFHGQLRRAYNPQHPPLVDAIRLYERSALDEYCTRFLRLLGSDTREEDVQSFLESHPVFFSIFLPKKLMNKKPILSKYIADFVVLNERGELVLIEIEKPGIRLVKRDGGMTAELQHAFDQVRRWLLTTNEHRVAVLDGLGLKSEEVSKVRGVVVAGRTPKTADHARLIRSGTWNDIEFYTYDDLLKGLAELTRQIANT